MSATARGFVTGPAEGETIGSPLNGEVTFVARGVATGGILSAMEITVPSGEGPPLHLHREQDETVYLIEGSMRWKLDGEVTASPPGSYIFIPRGLPHCFQNVGEGDARMLVTFSPAGMERFFERLAPMTAFDPAAFSEAAAESGMEVVGPRLVESDPL